MESTIDISCASSSSSRTKHFPPMPRHEPRVRCVRHATWRPKRLPPEPPKPPRGRTPPVHSAGYQDTESTTLRIVGCSPAMASIDPDGGQALKELVGSHLSSWYYMVPPVLAPGTPRASHSSTAPPSAARLESHPPASLPGPGRRPLAGDTMCRLHRRTPCPGGSP